MKAHGVDAVEISGNYYAVGVKALVDIPVILVGGHRSVEKMNQLLNETAIEFLSLSRPLIQHLLSDAGA